MVPTVFLGLAEALDGLLMPGVLEGVARLSCVLGRVGVLLSAGLVAAGLLAAGLVAAGFLAASDLEEVLGGSGLVDLAAGEGRVRGESFATGVVGLETSKERKQGEITSPFTI